MLRTLAGLLFLTFSTVAQAAVAPLEDARVTTFRAALTEMRQGNWQDALKIAEGAGPVARDVIEWHRLRAARGDFDAVQNFLERNGDWPGLQLLRRRSEKVLPLSARPDDIIAFFAVQPPQTGGGAVALAAAYREKGMMDEAEAIAVRAWLDHLLSVEDETWLFTRYSDALKPLHEDRLDMLLWREAVADAERMYPRVSKGMVALAKARLALRANEKGVDTLIEAVPAAYASDPGLAFERMQWRARRGNNAGAIDLILKHGPDDLGDASRWGGWRKSLARTEMREGRIDRAYRLAADHGLTEGTTFSDLEWLAGYLSLRYRKDAEKALWHFERLRDDVESPISLGRAGYWIGRAHEALGNTEAAQTAYAAGALHQTSFYGLLAAEKAGVEMDPALTGLEEFPPIAETRLATSTVFEAGRLFIATGEKTLAAVFLSHLAEQRPRDEVGALGDYVMSQDEPYLAVMISKRVAREGLVIPKHYFPVVDLGVSPMPVPPELPLAIARRESEFNPVVQSGVGASGLMQLMPGTAQDVSRYLEISYSKSRLTSDPVYNARLGTTYLDELMAWFDGNPVMVSAAYNAGPGRPLNWMKSLRNPLRGERDIIDWIEHVPFDETRNYIMRVTESLPVYRARLSGQTEPITFSKELLATPGHKRQAVKGRILRPVPRPVATD